MSVFNEMVELLDSTWNVRDIIVPCLEGSPGIGKTAAVMQHAVNVGAGKVVTIIASQILPNEVSGITMPVPETKAMEIFDHYRLSSLKDGDVLFFDELLEADQLVLSACLTLIESRQLMSGRKLPDIQIIAATNDSIKSSQLKLNIRQRFLWKHFGIDRQGCGKYIKEKYGLQLGVHILNKITDGGEGYNVLTQRSLTKMADWISRAETVEEADKIAKQIDKIWGSKLGSDLLEAYVDRASDPEAQFKEALGGILADMDVEVDLELSVEQLVEMLQTLPEWAQIAAQLAEIQMK